MPRISAFHGIVIKMYFEEHPPPHFHAVYAEFEAALCIKTLAVIEGAFPTRCLRLTRRWAMLHCPELLANWYRARVPEPLVTIDPLS